MPLKSAPMVVHPETRSVFLIIIAYDAAFVKHKFSMIQNHAKPHIIYYFTVTVTAFLIAFTVSQTPLTLAATATL